MALAERIRREIAAVPVSTDDGPLRVTASCGVAVSEAGKPLDSQELLHAADEALYSAKEQGRNRVVLAASLVPVHAESSQTEPAPLKSKSR
ncbi:MAG TPA: diguanylate cyclase [Candidatus Acidoferrales bacterium]|nr:diguanylate cyclase [Candidatus Acidoferrales bacterium]